MEQKQTQSQQSDSPVKLEKKVKSFLPTLTSVLLVCVLVSNGLFFWQQTILRKQALSLSSQLKQIGDDNAALTTRLESLEKVASEAAAEKAELERKTCKGVWKDGVCIKSTCIDSDVNEKPDDTYIKGSVTYTNENGVETTVYDECTSSKTQVNEMWCYESPVGSGNYVQGKMVYSCKKGCLDGACIK